MKSTLSVVMITKNAEELLGRSLGSVSSIANEIIVVDDRSTDDTVKIAKNYRAKVYTRHDANLGAQKKFGISKAKGEWILILDADEIVSEKLRNEIKNILRPSSSDVVAYRIPFINHFLGRVVKRGGEDYKMVRLVRKKYIKIEPYLVHEHLEVTSGKTGLLKNPILHYSYRSLGQVYSKFTDYEKRDAREKLKKGEKSSLKKMTMYGPHMVYARFIKDKGYKDGLFRLPLDIGFGYMESLTYILLFYYSLHKQ